MLWVEAHPWHQMLARENVAVDFLPPVGVVIERIFGVVHHFVAVRFDVGAFARLHEAVNNLTHSVAILALRLTR